jgi:hypothetical protein
MAGCRASTKMRSLIETVALEDAVLCQSFSLLSLFFHSAVTAIKRRSVTPVTALGGRILSHDSYPKQ